MYRMDTLVIVPASHGPVDEGGLSEAGFFFGMISIDLLSGARADSHRDFDILLLVALDIDGLPPGALRALGREHGRRSMSTDQIVLRAEIV